MASCKFRNYETLEHRIIKLDGKKKLHEPSLAN